MREPETDVLASYPAEVAVDAADVRAAADRIPTTLVVLDDDPTGTQSVADLPVLTAWEPEDFARAFSSAAPAVYVLTNTRSLGEPEAAERNRVIARNALAAATAAGVDIAFVSRGDSTLRGHFPLETDVLSDTVAEVAQVEIDGIVIVPAFPDAGRITIGGVHFMRSAGGLTPVGETEFARDATFGYRSSGLAAWVEEKTHGAVAADQVVVLDLGVIRAGTAAIVAALRDVHGRTPIVCDAVTEDDLRALSLGLIAAQQAGKSFVYRVGPPFVRARIGQEQRAPLAAAEIFPDEAESAPRGGLIVVGSHVAVTTRQLDALRRAHPETAAVEIDVTRVLDPSVAPDYLIDLAVTVTAALERSNVIVSTSRVVTTAADPDESLRIARTVSDAVVRIVQAVIAGAHPRFVVAKGGITSSDVAAHGLAMRRATVRGPMLPGIVSLWEPADGPARGIPYVVFAGNVGDDDALVAVVDKLTHPALQENAMPATPETSTVAVLGLGAMGLPMATRLTAGLTVHGFDIAPARLDLAAAAGVVPFGSAREAVDGVDAVLLAVRDAAQLDDVLFGEHGIERSLRAGAVVILTSTVGTAGIGPVAGRLAARGVDLVDAPLSGGPVRAGAGDLLVVVGAAPEARAKAAPVLDLLASTLTVVGDRPGDGQALKTVNQLLCGVHIAAAAEALALADALGLDREKTLDALMGGAAASFMLGNRGPRMLEAYDEGGAEVLSRLDIFVKDMGIVGDAARATGIATPVAAAAEQLYLHGKAHGLGTADDSAVIRVLAPERLTD